jgi:hypothetical protein
MKTAATGVVVLCAGHVVRSAVVELLADLETRGFRFFVERGRLLVSPASELTDFDDLCIRANVDELRAIVRACGDRQ